MPGRGQDNSMNESMGPLYQRDKYHLGITDIHVRHLLINAALRLLPSAGPSSTGSPQVPPF